jgi:hypothetical protein
LLIVNDAFRHFQHPCPVDGVFALSTTRISFASAFEYCHKTEPHTHPITPPILPPIPPPITPYPQTNSLTCNFSFGKDSKETYPIAAFLEPLQNFFSELFCFYDLLFIRAIVHPLFLAPTLRIANLDPSQ